MKKLLSSILTFTLVTSMSVTAFAADNTATNDGSKGTDITVNGTYKAADAPAEVISVDVMWDSMDFTYTAPSKGNWNSKTHAYEGATEGSWTWNGATETKTAPAITVTNHSNTAVKAGFAFTGQVSGLNGNFVENALVLDTAVGTEIASAPKAETSFSVSGSGIDADKKLGTITVTIAKYDAEAKYKVTAEEFANLLGNVNNFKLVISGNSNFVGTYFYDGESLLAQGETRELICTRDGKNYYSYVKEAGYDDWIKEVASEQDYQDISLIFNLLPYMKDSFDNLSYDTATKAYKCTLVQILGTPISNLQFCFEDGALKEASFSSEDLGTYSYSNLGSVAVEIPTNLHEHTYAAEWTYDDNYHWHAVTCRHTNEIIDEANHVWGSGVCTVCGRSFLAISEDGTTITDLLDNDTQMTVVVPAGVTTIGYGAFLGSSLTEIVFPQSLTTIRGSAFTNSSLQKVFYSGTQAEWDTVEIYNSENTELNSATVYFYSETKPTESGNFWHYVDGVATIWS